MNPRIRNRITYSLLGGLGGVGVLIVLVMGLVLLRGSPRRDSLAALFASANRPLEILPWADELAERQDPVLTFGIMLAYWALLGVLGSNVIFLFKIVKNLGTRGSRNGH